MGHPQFEIFESKSGESKSLPSREKREKGEASTGTILIVERRETGKSCPPVQKVGGRGLARLDKDEYDKDVLI